MSTLAASAVPVPVPVPARFRFGMFNPITETEYSRSRFADLPDFAAWIVTDILGCRPGEWDQHVRERRVAELVSARRVFTLPSWSRHVRDQAGRLIEEISVGADGAGAWF